MRHEKLPRANRHVPSGPSTSCCVGQRAHSDRALAWRFDVAWGGRRRASAGRTRSTAERRPRDRAAGRRKDLCRGWDLGKGGEAARTDGRAGPAKRAPAPSASSMRRASFHFAMRSERAKRADLELRHAPADGEMDDGHVLGLARARRDDGAEPAARAASSAALASVSVPTWFGLISTALQAPRGGGRGRAPHR